MNAHKDIHSIQTDINDKNKCYLLRDILNDLVLPHDKCYDIAIHLRFAARPEFIEIDHYLNLFESIRDTFKEKKICLI